LVKATATGGFHPAFDTAVITAFEQLDEEIKRLDPSGTTAAVLFFKKSDDGDVHVKCAWVGDSRVVLTRDFDPSRTMDLSDDHKPESASEVARIRDHYEALHGGAKFKSRDEVLEHFEASVRGGKIDGGEGKKPLPPGFGKIGNHSNGSSPGGSSRGNSRPQSRGNSQRGGTLNSRGGSRNGPNLAARDGLPAVEMTLGHSEAMEESVWGALEGHGEGGDPGAVEVVVTTKAQRDARGAVTEAFEASVSIEDLTELREIASRSPGAGEGSAARGDSANGTSSVPTEIVDGTSVAFTSVEMRRSVDDAIVASFGEEDTFASASNQLPPSRDPSGGKLALRDSETTSGATTNGSPIRENAEAADSYDESEDAVGSLGGDSDPAFRRVDLARMSFVGYYKDEQGKALSKPRIYSSSGESHGVSRSIGDRGSARACVATPEIRTVVVPFGSGARFMACSDGVWDAFSSDKATRRVSRFVTPQGAAKRMCVYARERMEYRGMHADDITAVVVDIGANARGGDPQCACVVS
jgi:serine/threonine protein phosphatase PrpC